MNENSSESASGSSYSESEEDVEDENERVKAAWGKVFPVNGTGTSHPALKPKPKPKFKRIKTPEPETSSSDSDDGDGAELVGVGHDQITQRVEIPLSRVNLAAPNVAPPIKPRGSLETPDCEEVSDLDSESEDGSENHTGSSDGEEIEDNEPELVDNVSDQSSVDLQQGYQSMFDDAESLPDSPEEDPDFETNDDKLDQVEAPQWRLRPSTSLEKERDNVDEDEDQLEQETEPVPVLSSSSSSSSDEEAVNELNEPTLTLDRDDTWEIMPETILWHDIPLLPTGAYAAYEKHADIGLHSTYQFYVEIYIEFGQYSARHYKFPADIVRKFREMENIRVSERNYIPEKFLFNHKHYDQVLEILRTGDVELTIHLDNVFVRVVKALAKYNKINDDVLASGLMEKKLRKFERFRDLRQYQKDSIVFSITRRGRCMLADEARMGKGVEAIFASAVFEEEWPMLIMCRTSLQSHWESECENWLFVPGNKYAIKCLTTVEDCDELVKSSKEQMPDIAIIGYTLLQTPQAQALKECHFRVLIIDESHRIKHIETKTARAAFHLIKRAKRRILLSSNPAFGVPKELFRQLHVIDREAFHNHTEFADRYCGFEVVPGPSGETNVVVSRSWKMAKNLDELKQLMFGTVVKRHFRQDVAVNRNIEKNREVVALHFEPDSRTRVILEALYKKYFINQEKLESLIDVELSASSSTKAFKWYKKSGMVKVPMICKYLDTLLGLEKDKKIIIYARHIFVIEGIELLLKRMKIKFVKIDKGYDNRKDLCKKFNTSRTINVALLSMNLSDVGVDLSAAEMVIFAELYWVPDALFKNEDRAIGDIFREDTPSKTVEIKYLLARDRDTIRTPNQFHIDNYLWEILLGKMSVLEKLGLSKEDFTNLREVDFTPVDSSVVDDIDFGNISSGLESEEDEEYRPESDVEEEDDDDSSSSNASADELDSGSGEQPSQSSDEEQEVPMDTQDQSSVTSLGGVHERREPPSESDPSNEDEAGSCSGSLDGSSDGNGKAVAKKTGGRVTRSQVPPPVHVVSSSTSNESSSEEEELQSCFPAPRLYSDSSDSESDSIESFIVKDGEGEDEEEESPDSESTSSSDSSKQPLLPEKKRRNRSCPDTSHWSNCRPGPSHRRPTNPSSSESEESQTRKHSRTEDSLSESESEPESRARRGPLSKKKGTKRIRKNKDSSSSFSSDDSDEKRKKIKKKMKSFVFN